MTCVWVTSDWHLGHKNQTKFREGFESPEAVAECLFDNYTSLVSKRDIVYFLGDVAFNKSWLWALDRLPGEKRLILGNHDTDSFAKDVGISDLSAVFSQIHGLKKYKQSWLSHCPIHPSELHGRFNVHGHLHFNQIEDYRYVNVCPEWTDYKPVKYQNILDLQRRYRKANEEE